MRAGGGRGRPERRRRRTGPHGAGGTGAPGGWKNAQAEQAAERTDEAAGGGDLGEKGGGGGLGEQGFELRGVGGGLVAEGADEPVAAMGQHGPAARTAATRAAGPGKAAGGEESHQAFRAAGEKGKPAPQRDDEEGEARIGGEAPRDEGAETGHNGGEPTGEVGEEGVDRGREGRGGHE